MADTSMSRDSTPETKWHEWYNDPACDVVVVANDDVHFRASSHRLAKASDMFAKMFEVVPPTSAKKGRKSKSAADAEPEPIPIAFDSKTVKAFLDLTSLSTPVILTKNFWVITSLRDLVRVHDCAELVAHMDGEWEKAFNACATEAFIYASQLNDVEMGRKALKSVSRYTVEYIASGAGYSGSSTTAFWAWLDRLRPEWHAQMLRLIIKKETYGDFRIIDDWSKIADKFNPADPIARKRPRSESL